MTTKELMRLWESRTKNGELMQSVAIHFIDKHAVDCFLSKHLLSQQQILAETRKAYRSQPSATLKGQIQYYTHQVATIKWLLSINSQRRVDGASQDDTTSSKRKSV